MYTHNNRSYMVYKKHRCPILTYQFTNHIPSPANLDKLRSIEQLGPTLPYLFDKHIPRVLSAITSDALTWDLMTPDRCLLETVLVYSGEFILWNLICTTNASG